MAADWLIRVHTPAWLRLAKLNEQADLLASLPEITDFKNCPSLMPALTAVRKDADAAGAAAWRTPLGTLLGPPLGPLLGPPLGPLGTPLGDAAGAAAVRTPLGAPAWAAAWAAAGAAALGRR